MQVNPRKCLLRFASALLLLLTLGSGDVYGTTQTFTFNSTAGHTALGLTSPSKGAGTDLDADTDYTLGDVTMNITHGSSTNTRIWNKNGSYDLRVYSGGGSITFTVSSAYYINCIQINSKTNLSASTPTGGSWSSNTWSPATSTYPTSATFTASATANITTVVVTYTAAASCSTNPTVTSSASLKGSF